MRWNTQNLAGKAAAQVARVRDDPARRSSRGQAFTSLLRQSISTPKSREVRGRAASGV